LKSTLFQTFGIWRAGIKAAIGIPSIPSCHDKYWDGWLSSDGQTTSINSASYPQWNGKWVPASVAILCGWGL